MLDILVLFSWARNFEEFNNNVTNSLNLGVAAVIPRCQFRTRTVLLEALRKSLFGIFLLHSLRSSPIGDWEIGLLPVVTDPHRGHALLFRDVFVFRLEFDFLASVITSTIVLIIL